MTIMWTIIVPGVLLGLISSLHCVGMCGPLALALPVQHLTRSGRVFALLSYHGGRLLTYTLLGGLSGLLGRRIYLGGLQQAFSITVGSLILLWLAMVYWYPAVRRPVFMNRLFRPVEHIIARLWQSPSRTGFLLLGMANGLLPCGMVYLAIAGSLSFPQIDASIAFMLFFGIGTLPALLILGASRHLITISARANMRRAVPYVAALMGVLLILRGLDLGIPFISPVLAHSPGQAVSCH
jgi:sulfite exporter TauE/SafE